MWIFPGLDRRGSRPRLAVRRTAPRAATGIHAARRMRHVILLISANNLLHQIMPHHILLAELHHANPFNLPANFQRLDQPRFFSLR